MRALYPAILNMSFCKHVWPDDAVGMSKINIHSVVDGLDGVSLGTYKYIPQEKLNNDLGLPNDAGVYGYYKFLEDGSYIILTCNHGIAVWSGKEKDKAYFPDYDNLLRPSPYSKKKA